jgi:hypothetical protein
MAELERELAALDVDWPPTPAFDVRRPARRRWPFVAAATAAAVGVAFAVPPARSGILRLFHLRGVSIEHVQTLPAAAARPIVRELGVPVSAAEARAVLGRPFGVDAQLYRSGDAVSALLAGPVLLTELRVGVPGDAIVKKILGGEADAITVLVGGRPAIWIAGAPHVFQLPPSSPRLAGNTLLWERGSVLFRLEGRALSQQQAQALARLLTPPG